MSRLTATKDAHLTLPLEIEDLESSQVDHDDRLILWFLEKTPTERLEILQQWIDGITAIRNARKIGQ